MNTTTYHRLPSDVLLQIQGQGGRSVDEVRRMYQHYAVSTPDEVPDIRLRLADLNPNPTSVLGQPHDYFGREGDRFVIRNKSMFLSTDPEWSDIRVSPNWEPFHVVYPIEFAVRKRLAEDGEALVHAACVQFEGQMLLFPAWRGAGKTNTMFSLLTAGGDFLSDDRVWVDGTGGVRGHPMPTTPHTEQFESFPQLRKPGETPREQVVNFVEANVDPNRSFPEKVVVWATQRFLDTIDRDFREITEVVPRTKWIPEGRVDAVVRLQAAPQNRHVNVVELSATDLTDDLRAIHDYEWNALLRKYFTAFDSLFPGYDLSGSLEEVIRVEEQVFDELAETAPTYGADIPRERDWRSTGISSEVVEKLGRLDVPDVETRTEAYQDV